MIGSINNLSSTYSSQGLAAGSGNGAERSAEVRSDRAAERANSNAAFNQQDSVEISSAGLEANRAEFAPPVQDDARPGSEPRPTDDN